MWGLGREEVECGVWEGGLNVGFGCSPCCGEGLWVGLGGGTGRWRCTVL